MGYTIIVFPFLTGAGQIVLALVTGMRIWRQSTPQAGAQRTTLRLLALNLIEPAINAPMIVGALFGGLRYSWNDRLLQWDGIPYVLLITAPMAVLLLPFLWARSADPVCRSINLKLGTLGVMRWLVTALTFVVPFVMLLGLIVLGLSIRWVKGQAFQAVGSHYQAIGVGVAGVMVGELQDFGGRNQADVRL